MRRIKLLVVDDSILFREVLSRYISQDVQIDIVGKAGDAYSARDMILKYEPDVMTLDIEMPRMDGVSFLKKLLPQYYIPTIVISSSEERRQAAQEAGCVQFIKKPITRTNSEMEKFANELCTAIKLVRTKAISKDTNRTKPTERSTIIKPIDRIIAEESSIKSIPGPNRKFSRSDTIIALGASTGGTEALEQVIRVFPKDTPPVIVVQHMPAGFTKLYAERMNRSCLMDVKEAEDGDRLRSGLVIIGAGEHHLRLCRDSRGYYVSSKTGEKVSGHCPSVDVMFSSVAENAGANAIGAILTGMGRDGADGLLKMRNAGAFTIGQDKQTSVVYGMPMEAYNIGAVEVQAPLYQISDFILNALY